MDISVLGEWNPWWTEKTVPEEFIGKRRREYSSISESLNLPEVTIITGVRRSGKSTLMYQMIDGLLKKELVPEQILLANFEDPKIAATTLEELYEAYRTRINPDRKAYVFFDEVHKKEGWEKWIRKQYDLKKDCKFIITSSSSHLLKKEYSTLLTGRNLSFEVFPLSFREYLSFTGVQADDKALELDIAPPEQRYAIGNALEEYLNHGGFPDAVTKEEPFKTKILLQYFDDIIYKDIVDRYNVDARKTKELAQYLITNFTKTVSLRSIRNVLGLSYETTKDYLGYYQDAYLLFSLEHFSYSLKEQKTRPSKAYCIDDGLRNAASFRFSKDAGRLAENLVYITLRQKGQNAYYWTDGQKEVDYIIKNPDQTLTAINVAYTDEIDEREVKSIQEFKKQHPKTREMIIITQNTQKTEGGIRYVPLWKWLLLD